MVEAGSDWPNSADVGLTKTPLHYGRIRVKNSSVGWRGDADELLDPSQAADATVEVLVELLPYGGGRCVPSRDGAFRLKASLRTSVGEEREVYFAFDGSRWRDGRCVSIEHVSQITGLSVSFLDGLERVMHQTAYVVGEIEPRLREDVAGRMKITRRDLVEVMRSDSEKLAATVPPPSLKKVPHLRQFHMPHLRRGYVYFLAKSDEVVYVGQACDLYARLRSHVKENVKDFDRVFFIECHPSRMDQMECHYIRKLRPKYNIASKPTDEVVAYCAEYRRNAIEKKRLGRTPKMSQVNE